MMVEIIIGFIVVLITVFGIYFLRSKCSNKTSHSKITVRQDLLKARLKYFQKNEKNKKPIENSSMQTSSGEQASEVVSNKINVSDSNVEKMKEGDNKSVIKKKTDITISEVFINAPLDSAQSAVPATQPISTLEELHAWIPGYDEFSVSSIARRAVSRDESKGRTLVCHDMKGGYLQDRFPQGFSSNEGFRMHYWNFIDSFCYFSHHLVTIPPPCWTNAAHIHGVQCFGTFITESTKGSKICTEIFKEKDTTRRIVGILVDIALYYKFDGWLINIENDIIPVQVSNLIFFLKLLTKEIHLAIPGSKVIWYDSVLFTGQLKWQNRLCAENKVFFDACDGIYLNYQWSPSLLRTSAVFSGVDRRHDVYAGIDVFGRHTYGGGGWHTHNAKKVIREHNLSAAIFAPGWVLEEYGTENFLANNAKFWELLAPYLYSHHITALPLTTNFSQGYGITAFIRGQDIGYGEWTNLSAQGYQPTYLKNTYQVGPKEGMRLSGVEYMTSDGYDGGGCLCVVGSTKPREEQTRSVVRLFKTDVQLEESTDYTVVVTFKSDSDQVQFYVLMLFADKPSYMVLEMGQEDIDTTCVIQRYEVPEDQRDNCTFVSHEECKPDKTEIKNADTWTTRCFSFSMTGVRTFQELRVVCTTGGVKNVDRSSSFALKIGELKVCKTTDLRRPIAPVIHLRCRNISSVPYKGTHKKISFTLNWQVVHDANLNAPKAYDVFCYGVSGQEFHLDHASSRDVRTTSDATYGRYVGRAHCEAFYIDHLRVPLDCGEGVVFIVQAIDRLDKRQAYSACAKTKLKW